MDPSPAQERALASHAGAARFAYNFGLALVKDRLDRRHGGEQTEVPWTLPALRREWNEAKHKVAPWWAENSKEAAPRGVGGHENLPVCGRRNAPLVATISPHAWPRFYGDGPVVCGVQAVLFYAWLAWSRYRVVVPLRDKTMASVVIGLDHTLRLVGGVPTYEYVPRHILFSDRRKHAAKPVQRVHVPLKERLLALRLKRHHETRPREARPHQKTGPPPSPRQPG